MLHRHALIVATALAPACALVYDFESFEDGSSGGAASSSSGADPHGDTGSASMTAGSLATGTSVASHATVTTSNGTASTAASASSSGATSTSAATTASSTSTTTTTAAASSSSSASTGGGTGSPCTTGTTCDTGQCVDGFCCDVACTGACMACSNALTGAANGQCAAVVAGTPSPLDCPVDSTDPCGNTGSCGASGCEKAAVGTFCGSSCSGALTVSTYTCSGGGACNTVFNTNNCNLDEYCCEAIPFQAFCQATNAGCP